MDTIKDRLDNAFGHLHAAKIQMIPRDDQIICDHVRTLCSRWRWLGRRCERGRSD